MLNSCLEKYPIVYQFQNLVLKILDRIKFCCLAWVYVELMSHFLLLICS